MPGLILQLPEHHSARAVPDLLLQRVSEMVRIGNEEKRLRAELLQVLPPTPQVLMLSPPFLAPAKS